MIKRVFHRYGFGIQSPWAYSLVRNVLFEPLRYYAYDELKAKHAECSRKERKRNEQLFRIVNHFKPLEIVVAGNCPLSTLDYLQSPVGSTVSQTPTESSAFYYYGAEALENVKIKNESPKVSLKGEFEVKDNVVVVIDDIGHSNKSLWEQLQNQPQATAIFDMGYRGMLVFDPKRVRQVYQL